MRSKVASICGAQQTPALGWNRCVRSTAQDTSENLL
jgi:hypothetical protein